MIYWTIGGVALVYLILLASRLLQAPVSNAQGRALGITLRGRPSNDSRRSDQTVVQEEAAARTQS